jgi:subtilisin family serine protease
MRTILVRTRRTAVVLATTAALIASALTLTTPTSAAPPAPSTEQPVSLAGVSPGPHDITLITGDKVILGESGGDRHSVRVEGAVRPDGGALWFRTLSTPDGTYVLPSDAEPAIQAGLLDKELFNVEYLAANGYSDAATNQIPVLVSYGLATARTAKPDSGALAGQADRLPATSAPVGLSSINGAGVDVAKQATSTLWAQLRAPLAGRGLTARTPATLGAGVAKVWLDRKVTANLAESVPLIGAPEAWSAGYDGADVTVAVLDTGIDANHPDVAGKVIGSKSFVSDSTVDGAGHGTHVAATVAGNGSASGGSRKGVAPGAKLLIGKVLDDGGSGSFESIIAGMEWAATEQHADIVSMSLGACCSDGSDPASVALDNLSASTGTLFVVAAGNSGPQRETIASPASADAALTVAATSKQDGLAGFSSRGPRPGNLALKPELAAPGVDIVAARAAGTALGSPVDANYTKASGTSMATPHIAGAAAVLAQRHPDWKAPQLKAALMSTAHDVGATVYQTGAGRVDVARAVRQQVFATTGKADFGIVEIPSGGTPAPQSRAVEYTNLSGQPVTLTLTSGLRTVDGGTVPDGTVTTAGSLTVPAGGTASTTITITPGTLAQHEYTGALVATDSSTGTRLTTPIGMVLQPKKLTLTVRTLGRDGKPATPQSQDTLDVSGPNGADFSDDVFQAGEGITKVAVFPGTYSVTQLLSWVDADNRLNGMLLADPEIAVTADTEIVLDGRTASQIEFQTPKPAEPLNNWASMAYQRDTASGEGFGSVVSADAPIGSWVRLWATPTEQVRTGKFRFWTQSVLGRSEVSMTVQGRRLPIVVPLHSKQWVSPGSPDQVDVQHSWPGWVPFTGTRDLQLVDVGHGTAEDLARADVRGKLVLLATGKTVAEITQCRLDVDRLRAVHAAGAVGVVAYPAPDHACPVDIPVPLAVSQKALTGPKRAIGIPNVALSTREGVALREQLRTRTTVVRTAATPETPYTYVLKPYEEGRIPASLRYTMDGRNLGEHRLDYHAARATELNDYQYIRKSDDLLVDPAAISYGTAFTGPHTYTEYFGPVAADVWRVRATGGRQGGNRPEGYFNRVTRAGSPTLFVKPDHDSDREQWYTIPKSPGVPTAGEAVLRQYGPTRQRQRLGDCLMCRQGSLLWAQLRLVTGGPGNRQTDIGAGRAHSPEEGVRDFDVRLYRGDTEVKKVPAPWPVFDLPAEPATYRMTAKSQATDTAWTFRSAEPTAMSRQPGYECLLEVTAGSTVPCSPEPMVFVSYDLDRSLSMTNTVSDRVPQSFSVHAYHTASTVAMPRIAGLTLSVSYDGGNRWTPVSVSARGDGRFDVRVNHPPERHRPTDSVSLKAEAWDAAGNRIQQVTRDAFTLTR